MADRVLLPTFLVIGAMKSGSSSLHRYLDAHPEISMSVEKELHFFSDPAVNARGLGWYGRQFAGGTPCRGESSVTYSKCHLYPGTAQRIRDTLPGVRLIYLVRDPIERTISHYLHIVRHHREPRSLERALTEPLENKYTLTSRYMMQLDAHLLACRKADVLVVALEKLTGNPTSCMQQIFRFLGVDSSFTSAAFTKVHNRTKPGLRRSRLARLAGLIPRARVFGHRLISVPRPLTRLAGTDPKLELDPRVRERLVDYFHRDIDRLERFTGLRFPSWTHGPVPVLPADAGKTPSSFAIGS